jgi:plasmid stability protein
MISIDASLGTPSVAQIIVRGLEEEVKLRLQRRARRHGRSMEEEIRHILRGAVAQAERPAVPLGTAAAALFGPVGLRTELPELKGQAAVPIKLRR